MSESPVADPSEVFDRLVEIIAEETGHPTTSMDDGTTFAHLDVDALSMLTILTLAEEEFSVQIPDEVGLSLATVGDAVRVVLDAGPVIRRGGAT